MQMRHLLSTIIGKSVHCILEYCSNNVKRINYMGDWGMQFGMLIQFLREKYPDIGADDDGVEKETQNA
eukprot:6440220-Ditylum_brightwellii.AAC.1